MVQQLRNHHDHFGGEYIEAGSGSGSGRLLRLNGFPHDVRGSVPRTVMYFLTVLLQTRDGPLLFSKESATLTCSQGYLSDQHGTTSLT